MQNTLQHCKTKEEGLIPPWILI